MTTVKLKDRARERLLALAHDDRESAESVLAEYGIVNFHQIPDQCLEAFEDSVRATHIRYLLNRLEEVSLS